MMIAIGIPMARHKMSISWLSSLSSSFSVLLLFIPTACGIINSAKE